MLFPRLAETSCAPFSVSSLLPLLTLLHPPGCRNTSVNKMYVRLCTPIRLSVCLRTRPRVHAHGQCQLLPKELLREQSPRPVQLHSSFASPRPSSVVSGAAASKPFDTAFRWDLLMLLLRACTSASRTARSHGYCHGFCDYLCCEDKSCYMCHRCSCWGYRFAVSSAPYRTGLVLQNIVSFPICKYNKFS